MIFKFKNSKLMIVLLLYAVFFLSCSKDSKIVNLKTGKLVKEFSIKSASSESSLIQVTGFDIDRDDNIYAFDKGDFQLKKFDPQGRLITSIGREGRGPGEFQDEITFIELNEKNIYSFVSAHQLVKVFDTDLNYKKTLNLQRHPADISSNNQGILIGLINSESDKDILYRSTFELDVVDKSNADLSITGVRPFSSYVVIDYLDDDSFFIGYRFKNLIQYFSSTDSLLYDIKLPNIPKESTYYNNVPESVIIRDIAYSEVEKYLYILEGYNTERGKQLIYVLDSNTGNLIYQLSVPVLTHSIVYQNGYIYTSAGRGSDIIRFKIDYKD